MRALGSAVDLDPSEHKACEDIPTGLLMTIQGRNNTMPAATPRADRARLQGAALSE